MSEIYRRAERLEEILIAVATGRAYTDVGEEYKTLRAEFVTNPTTTNLTPDFVRTYRTVLDYWPFIKKKFSTYAERRTFIREAMTPLLCAVQARLKTPGELATDAALSCVDSSQISRTWQKALDRKDGDPEGAITMARTLLEEVCKHILDAQAIGYSEGEDLPALYGALARSLKIAPSQQTEPEFRKVFGACHSVVDGLAALRNRLGDAHGKRRASLRPCPRHAELAVNLAGSMALFLLGTWEELP